MRKVPEEGEGGVDGEREEGDTGCDCQHRAHAQRGRRRRRRRREASLSQQGGGGLEKRKTVSSVANFHI